MANEISPQGRPQIHLESTRSEGRAQAQTIDRGKTMQPGSQPHTTDQTDQVSLTGESQLLRQIEQALESAPVMDQQKVAEVRVSLEQGSFRLDANKIADRLLGLERDLARKPK